jgi:hypothetical protein
MSSSSVLQRLKIRLTRSSSLRPERHEIEVSERKLSPEYEEDDREAETLRTPQEKIQRVLAVLVVLRDSSNN